ncbi:NUDIX hydrolase [Raineyella sp. LH-20]|uniref:NUDIX hydrolase n=1 Tax=Raineyella sp. LH-20 TaxID=3081204 RepID=UPI002955A7E9|nr:NUDIX hydrolase [Raineyella sp. LH-20]WOP17290.1 NUDIX hydrolase [Raineyella sp. LH-20]
MTTPSPSPVLAAGAVVLRPSPTDDGAVEVLVVHRPRYDDWSLPKGHLDPGEQLPVTAVREVREETGWVVRLGARLDTTSYPVNGHPKEVHWWVGTPVTDSGLDTDAETDDVRWVSIEAAAGLLTFDSDRRLVRQAVERRPLVPFVLIRHGKALSRAKWSRADRRRPLTPRGERQALALVPLLNAFGIGRVHSSRAVRCQDTLHPYAQATGLTLTTHASLDEEAAETAPEQAGDRTRALAAEAAAAGVPTAVCGHRPVLPFMLAAIDVADRPFGTADAVVAYVAADGTSGADPDHFEGAEED